MVSKKVLGNPMRSTKKTTLTHVSILLSFREQAHLALGLAELLQSCAQPIDPKLEMMARAVKLVQQQQAGNGRVSAAKNGRPNGANEFVGSLNRHADSEGSASEGSEEGEEDQDELRALKEESELGAANGKRKGKGSKRRGAHEGKEVTGEFLSASKSKRKPSEGEVLEGQGKGKRKKKDGVEESNGTMSQSGSAYETASESFGEGKRKQKAAPDVAGVLKSAVKTKERIRRGEIESEDLDEDLEDDEGTLDEEERLQQAEGGSSKEEVSRFSP
jgi:hypothetical protein